ncbi:MAG TPA: hypothetical protein VGJ05_06820 [Fimbriiglobus sp.]
MEMSEIIHTFDRHSDKGLPFEVTESKNSRTAEEIANVQKVHPILRPKDGMPTPSHLAKCTTRIKSKCRSTLFVGKVKCTCGHEEMRLKFTATDGDGIGGPRSVLLDGLYYAIVEAICHACELKYLLFDESRHGWNGFLAGDNRIAPFDGKLTEWQCIECQARPHTAIVRVRGENPETAIEESESLLNGSNWFEGFGWISIDIKCRQCRKQTIDWLSWETA